MAKENEKDCIELVYNALVNTIEAEDKNDRKKQQGNWKLEELEE